MGGSGVDRILASLAEGMPCIGAQARSAGLERLEAGQMDFQQKS